MSPRPVVFRALPTAVTALFLALAMRMLDVEELRAVLVRAAVWPWVPLSVLSYLLGHLLRGWRCARLVRDEARLTLADATGVVVAGYAVNNVLPARMGELVRIGLLSRRTGFGLVQAATVTLAERVLDGLALLALVALATTLVSGPAWDPAGLGLTVLMLAGAGLAIALAAASPSLVVGVLSRLTLPLGPRVHEAALAAGLQVRHGLATMGRPAGALVVLGSSLMIWVLEAGMFAFQLPVHHLPLDWHWAVLVMAVTNLGLAIPSSPGHVGPFHYFCAQTLVALGVGAPVALGYALTVHVTFFVPITLWGLAVLWAHGMSLASASAMASVARTVEPAAEAPGSLARSIARVGRGPSARPPGRFLCTLVEAIVPVEDLPAQGPERDGALERTSRFLEDQIQVLPARLKGLFGLGMTLFRTWVLVRHLRAFEDLPLDRRRAEAFAWAWGRIALSRQLFRPVRSIALLVWHEDPVVRAAIGAGASGALP